jgi:NAD(P)-dependent dehydrogenase (short-subunit alcohol dehydrogenase family)
LAARNVEKLAALAAETRAQTFAADATDPAAVARLFDDADTRLGEPDMVLYNASARAHGPIADLDPEAVRKAIEISAYGGFLVVQQAARRMIPHGRGAILLTGASASVKGYPLSAAFAMGKFALRGLAQSTARELGPKGIHVAHFVIDGGVRSARRPDPAGRPDSTLDPDAIAQTYLAVLRQPRSAVVVGGRASALGRNLLTAMGGRQAWPAFTTSSERFTSGRAPKWLMISAAHKLPISPQT